MSRNVAAERARLDLTRPARQAALYQTLADHIGSQHQMLAGWPRILAFLTSLGVTRPNGHPISVTQLRRWRRSHALPIAPGYRSLNRNHPYSCPPFTTTHCLVAWLISQADLDGRLFRIYSAQAQRAA